MPQNGTGQQFMFQGLKQKGQTLKQNNVNKAQQSSNQSVQKQLQQNGVPARGMVTENRQSSYKRMTKNSNVVVIMNVT